MKHSTRTSPAAEYVDPLHMPERRNRLRHQPRSLLYVELDEGNGGIALNIGEDGIAVQAVMSLVDDLLPRVRFRLSGCKEWVETGAQVVWANENRKLLGLRFIELPEPSRLLIREWLDREQAAGRGENAPEILGEGLEGRSAPPPIPMPVLVMPSPPFVEPEASEPSAPEPAVPESAAAPAPASAPPIEPLIEAQIGAPGSHVAPSAEVAVPTFPYEAAHTGEPATVPSSNERAPVDAGEGPAIHPALAFQREMFQAPAEEHLPNRGSIAVFFLFLATASLAAGWAVGRGALADGIQKIRNAVLHEGSAGGATSATNSAALAAQPHLSDIEIVNLNNVHWTIPLSPAALSGGGLSRPEDAPSAGQGRKTQQFRTWVLTAPVQPRPAAASGATETAAPPALGGPVVTPPTTIPLAETPYSIPAPPPPTQSSVRPAQLIHRVDPVYPAAAISRRVEGIVKMRITVGANGAVHDVRVLSGPPLLTDPAVKAAGLWLYSPMLMNGKPADSEVDISVTFHLP